jgi:hypothetical protein
MARKSRRSGKSLSLFSRLFSPVQEAVGATGNSVRIASRSVGNIAGRAVNTVGKIGNRFAKGANTAVSKLTRGRKNRKNTRRNNTRRANRR